MENCISKFADLKFERMAVAFVHGRVDGRAGGLMHALVDGRADGIAGGFVHVWVDTEPGGTVSGLTDPSTCLW